MDDRTALIETAVMDRLGHVIDPELGRSVTDLGIIAGVRAFDHTERHGMDDRTALIETAVMDRLGHVIDPELGRSVTDLGIIAGVRAQQSGPGAYDVMVDVELTVPGCPLSVQISAQIEEAVASYPDADLTAHITVGSMDEGKLQALVSDLKAQRRENPGKLQALVSDLKAQRRENPFNKPGTKTRIFAVASGKGGVGKSSISANLAATFAALGYDTAAIDADIYGFSLPRLFGTHSQPTNLNGMLMPVTISRRSAVKTRSTNPARKRAFSRSPPARVAWANRRSARISPPHSPRSATTRPRSTPTSTASHCPACSAHTASRRISTACSCRSLRGGSSSCQSACSLAPTAGMFAGSDRAILWRGPRLQRSLEQFLADVWWGEPDVLILDLAPGTGDMAISVAQALPNAELVVVTTPQPSASDIAVRSGLVALQARCAHPRSGPRHRRYGDFSGAGAAERRTRRRHDPAAVRFRHRRAVRARRPAGADACAGGDREHELFRPRRRAPRSVRRGRR